MPVSATYTMAPPPGPVSMIASAPAARRASPLAPGVRSPGAPPRWKLKSAKPSVAPGAWSSPTIALPSYPNGEKTYVSAVTPASVMGAWTMFV